MRHTAEGEGALLHRKTGRKRAGQEGLMRGLANVVVRGVVAVSIVMALAVPAEAKPRDGGRWFEKRVVPIVKILKRMFAFKSQGDELTDPRP